MIIEVACAIIVQGTKVLLAQRSEKMNNPMKWEFPGGKVEKSEAPESTVIREIREELCLDVSCKESLPSYTHHYEDKIIHLYPFLCEYQGGTLTLREHHDIQWVEIERLLQFNLSAADIPAAKLLQDRILKN
ncbi:MAG: (deoxy)nucleoside triphosphate pyrophosphohydrolase [Cytophagaceae bacterium]|jgi:8-oxo-dGTP diphosphatase|nr:(deoxy)nucleoside triphosphate pyrophosphohydrolase [Cytophagaceae bacterium]